MNNCHGAVSWWAFISLILIRTSTLSHNSKRNLSKISMFLWKVLITKNLKAFVKILSNLWWKCFTGIFWSVSLKCFVSDRWEPLIVQSSNKQWKKTAIILFLGVTFVSVSSSLHSSCSCCKRALQFETHHIFGSTEITVTCKARQENHPFIHSKNTPVTASRSTRCSRSIHHQKDPSCISNCSIFPRLKDITETGTSLKFSVAHLFLNIDVIFLCNSLRVTRQRSRHSPC